MRNEGNSRIKKYNYIGYSRKVDITMLSIRKGGK